MYDDDFPDESSGGSNDNHGDYGGQSSGYKDRGQDNGGGYQNRNGGGGGYNKGGGGNYQNRNGGGGGYNKGNGGGYSGGGGGGGYNKGGGSYPKKGGFKAPEMKELYKPYLIAGGNDFPSNKTAELRSIVELLDKHAFTVRVNGMRGLGEVAEELVKQTRHELHIPWSGFDDKESKFGWAHPFASELLLQLMPSAEKLSPGIQKMMTTYIRMMLGSNLNSAALFAVIYSPDCAEKPSEKTKDTGNCEMIITLAHTYRRPVFNLAKADCEKRIRHYLGITE